MPDNCTLYCAINDLAVLDRLLEEYFPGRLIIAEDNVGARTVSGNAGSLRVTPRTFRENGDPFTRLLRSTSVFIQHQEGWTSEAKAALRTKVSNSQLTLGVVVEPDVDVDERYNDVIFAIAQSLDAVIFTGSRFMSATGGVIVEQSQ